MSKFLMVSLEFGKNFNATKLPKSGILKSYKIFKLYAFSVKQASYQIWKKNKNHATKLVLVLVTFVFFLSENLFPINFDQISDFMFSQLNFFINSIQRFFGNFSVLEKYRKKYATKFCSYWDPRDYFSRVHP